MKSHFERGNQIVYMPDHAKGSIKHPDVEFGFVTSLTADGQGAFCRYWSKYAKNELRTIANSESTNFRNLISYDSHDQGLINTILEFI